MSVFVLWVILLIVITIVKTSKAAGNSRVRGSQNSRTANRPPVRTQPRSFAAMPKQHSAAPNVERNCSADDKHRYENNLSRFNKKKPTAIPNVQNTVRQPQPKMSGNRKAARQLYIGDPVPHGMKAIRCSYCAADNLVPYTARDGYKCYFCHYDI